MYAGWVSSRHTLIELVIRETEIKTTTMFQNSRGHHVQKDTEQVHICL